MPDATPTAASGAPHGVQLDVAEAVAWVRIDRPAAHGALDHAAKVELASILARVAEDPQVRAVVLTGSGPSFCAGQDLREHASALERDATAAWETVREHYQPIATSLATMPKPVVAAVNGAAAGAGMAFALACDLRVMADTASLHVAFTDVGLSTDSGPSWTLPRLVGFGRAVDLLLRPRSIDAPAALALGLVHEVVPASALVARAAALAAELATGPTVAYGALKQALTYSAGHSLFDALDNEAGLQLLAGTTRDHAAAVRAFLEKRTPTFYGE